MRIDGKGLIDRTKPISFRFDGQRYDGFAGDTLASALLANDIRLMGRSFKYHRPRGVLTAGSEEPNALVTTGLGPAQEPNVRATTLELHEGLMARSQNRWPSLGFDLMAVNDLAAPFLGAGFYYKTFMWPKAFWEKIYEPVIRNAAGLGALSGEANSDKYEKAFAHCDLLVIGAGPAGLWAAMEGARAGLDVILCDEDTQPGGRLNAETETVGGMVGAEWAASVVAELRAMGNVRIMTRTAVIGAYDGGTYGAIERLAPEVAQRPGAARECFWRITAGQAVLAAGAPSGPVIAIAALYAIGAHGIMTLNDFKALEGDRQMGVNSLPVTLGPERAARVACIVMALPQLAVIGLLLAWGRPWHAAAIGVLVLGQFWAMRILLSDPKGRAPWYNGTGVMAYVTGMMIAAFALRMLGGAP